MPGGTRRPASRSRALGNAAATLGAAIALAASPARAQQQPPAGQIAPTREEVERPSAAPAIPPRAQLTVEGGVEHAPCALADPAYRGVTFKVNAVAFDDLQGLSPQDLRPAYADYVGTTQPVSVICEIRDRAATILRNAGYVAAVEVPAQRIADGTVRFQVLMAKLVAIRVRGDAGRAERIIARYLERLTTQIVFNRFDAERYLLLAGDLPGYRVRLSLQSANAGRGEVVGEVTVTRTPGQVDFNVQDFGSKDLGRFGGLVRAQLYDLTGLGDRTSIAFFSTADFKEQQTIQLGHEFRVGGEGLTLSGQFTYSWAHPALGNNFDVRARTLFATAEADYPILRTQAASIRGAAGLDLIDQKIGFNGIPLTRDHLRVGFLRLDMDAFDRASLDRAGGYSPFEPRWRARGSLTLRHGFGILGASDECGPAFAHCLAAGAIPLSRLEGEPTATLLRFEGAGEYRPVPNIAFSLGVRAQETGDKLLSFEEFSAGNYTAGRGYDPGTLQGDRGIGLQSELRVGSLAPKSPTATAIQGFAFFDYAKVWNEDRLNRFDTRQDLSSAGAGVRAAYGDGLQVELSLAVPLERAGFETHRPGPRLLLSLTTKLWPWS